MEEEQKSDAAAEHTEKSTPTSPTGESAPKPPDAPPTRSKAAMPIGSLLLASGLLSLCLGGLGLLALLQMAAGAALLGLWFKSHPLAVKLDPVWAHKHGKKGVIAGVALLFLITVGLGGSPIDVVKQSMLPLGDEYYWGDVIDNYPYYSSVEWRHFTAEDGSTVVEAIGTYDLSERSQTETVRNYPLRMFMMDNDDTVNVELLKSLQFVWQFQYDAEAEETELLYLGRRVQLTEGEGREFPVDDFFTEMIAMTDKEPSPVAGENMCALLMVQFSR